MTPRAGSRDGGGRVLPFRRPPVVARHKRRSLALAVVRGLAGALLLVGVPLAAAAWLLTSPRFDLQWIEVHGTPRVSGAWIEGALAGFRGSNLLLLSLAAVRERLAEHPWVATAEIRKRLPHRLEVRVEERRPAALLRVDDRLAYVDSAGHRIAELEPGRPLEGLPLLSAGSPAEVVAGLRVAARLEELAPSLGEGLSEIEVLSEEDFRIYTREAPYPVLLAAGRLEAGLALWRRHGARLERRLPAMAALDLRFPGRILIQNAEGAPMPAAVPRRAERER